MQVYPLFGESGARVVKEVVHCLAVGDEAPTEVKEGNLFLFPKKGVPSKENMRPITVTNAIYRIIMSVIRKLITERIDNLVGQHQKAFIPGRRMSDHIADVLEHFYMDVVLGLDVQYLLVDFAKAYDRMSRSSLNRIMEGQGWCPGLRRLIMTMNDRSAVFLIVGLHVQSIITGRGVRQGCPVSPLLFNLGIEPLARSLMKAGIQIWVFADDVILRLVSDEQAAKARELFSVYERATGSMVSEGKTVVVSPTGPGRDVCGWPGVKQATHATYLGVLFGKDIDSYNFLDGVGAKMEARLALFQPRKYSFSTTERIRV